MKLIQTITAGAGPTFSINFVSIPQTFTDLYLTCSVRDNVAAASVNLAVRLNNNSTANAYIQRRLAGTGSVAQSDNQTDANWTLTSNGTTSTADTFSNGGFYIPNYTGNSEKTVSVDLVVENNATAVFNQIAALRWVNTSAITQINLIAGGGFLQNTTVSLYGITKGSDGITTAS
jgi:hypothetical protein